MTKNCGESEEKQKQRQRAKVQPLPCEVCDKIDEYKKAVAGE